RRACRLPGIQSPCVVRQPASFSTAGVSANRDKKVRAAISKAVNAIVLTVALSVPGIAASAPFPAPLLGKSVTVNWGTDRHLKFEGRDDIVFSPQKNSLKVYISRAGRAFSKDLTIGRGGVRTEADQAPGDIRNTTGGNHVVHFDGSALLVDN